MFVSDMCNRHIVIRDVRDRDYNTSKANKPISKDIGTQNFYYLYLLGIHAEYLISYFGQFVGFSC